MKKRKFTFVPNVNGSLPENFTLLHYKSGKHRGKKALTTGNIAENHPFAGFTHYIFSDDIFLILSAFLNDIQGFVFNYGSFILFLIISTAFSIRCILVFSFFADRIHCAYSFL